MEDLVLSCLESRVEENRNLYARFLVGPFFKGDALTVATALRRVLLSSVESIAITALYIQGITHEFSTIVGVRESVLELSLNFQSIVLCYDKNFFQKKSFFEDFQIGYLQVQGPKIVYANDLKLPLGVKVVNPTQYIATVSREGILVLKFTMGKMDNRFITNPSSQTSELNSRNQIIHHPVFGELLKNNIVKTKRRYSYKNVYFIKKNVSFYPFVRKYLRTSIIPWSCLLFFTQKGKLYKTKFDKQKIRWRPNSFTSRKQRFRVEYTSFLNRPKVQKVHSLSHKYSLPLLCPHKSTHKHVQIYTQISDLCLQHKHKSSHKSKICACVGKKGVCTYVQRTKICGCKGKNRHNMKICEARPYNSICPSEANFDFDSTFSSTPLILPLTGEQKDRRFVKPKKKSNICTKRFIRSKILYNQPLRAKKYSYRSLFNPTLLPKSTTKLMRTPVCKIQKKNLVQKHEVSSSYNQNKSSAVYKINRIPQKFRNPLKSALLHIRAKCNSVFAFGAYKYKSSASISSYKFSYKQKLSYKSSFVARTCKPLLSPFTSTSTNQRFVCVKKQNLLQKSKSLVFTKPNLLKQSKLCKARTCICTKGFAPLVQSKRRICKHSKESKKTIRREHKIFQSDICLRNIIPLDYTLPPVLKVNFVIEIDDEVLYIRQKIRERISIEVWTNGSIHPRQAVHDATLSLLDMFSSFRTLYQVNSDSSPLIKVPQYTKTLKHILL